MVHSVRNEPLYRDHSDLKRSEISANNFYFPTHFDFDNDFSATVILRNCKSKQDL